MVVDVKVVGAVIPNHGIPTGIVSDPSTTVPTTPSPTKGTNASREKILKLYEEEKLVFIIKTRFHRKSETDTDVMRRFNRILASESEE